jgi:hypothetical protein
MKQSNAQRQKKYRQRAALNQLRNEYTVTLMLRECEKADIDIWPVLVDCAEEIFNAKGNAVKFIERVATLFYAHALAVNIINKLSASAHADPDEAGQ